MKKIGYTFDDGNHLNLVVLSDFEMVEIEKMLAERDLPAEEKDIHQWANGFRRRLDALLLPTGTNHSIARSLHWQVDLYRRDGKLLSFDEWADLVRSLPYKESPCFGVRSFGKTGYNTLQKALK